MSHYTRPTKSYGRRLVVKESSHVIRKCWNCGCDILSPRDSRARAKKLCADCKERLSNNEIKQLYSVHYKHQREQFKAKKTRPDLEKFIFNSPFRSKTDNEVRKEAK